MSSKNHNSLYFFPKTKKDRGIFWNDLSCLNSVHHISYILNKDRSSNNEENKNTHSSKVLPSHTALGHIWSHSGLSCCDCIDFIKLHPLYKHKWIHKQKAKSCTDFTLEKGWGGRNLDQEAPSYSSSSVFKSCLFTLYPRQES